MANESNDKKPSMPDMRSGAGIAIGIGVGVALGVALDNVAVGIAVGAGLGVLFTAAAANREHDEE